MGDILSVAVVGGPGEGEALAAALGIQGAVEVVVTADDDSLDALQDFIYGNPVRRVLLPDGEVLQCDAMSRQLMISGWRDANIEVLQLQRDETEHARIAAAAIEELNEYGKIPWIP